MTINAADSLAFRIEVGKEILGRCVVVILNSCLILFDMYLLFILISTA